MFRVYLVNHFYYLAEEFPSVEAALEAIRRTCFQARVERKGGGGVVASWCPIGGTRYYGREPVGGAR